jgi:signal transduction histidine kinase
LTLFRVVQEALTNIDKHAQATSAAVRLTFDPEGRLEPTHPGHAAVIIAVSDDGVGFDVSTLDTGATLDYTALAAKGHLGLAGMRERISLSGGEMRLETAPGRGAKLTFWFPLSGTRTSNP